ncbi:methyltransferase [Leptospira perolatii]|uniref:Methyltransferase n=1 Tax=Leptospira perolatii TaxID=2023191 RepID=A0A2M9ZL84_9LEPT|nr:class I SAM-dependent methyltransferase [Leptospira perolatii]PJZ70288.1 methyltransferase [Leptospira perolatii]PJZ72828.1 methyltransferase [Leptospira perolatii]
MECYLCKTSDFVKRPGSVRGNKDLEVLECKNCGLVALSSVYHISESHYEDSGMHENAELQSIESWLRITEADDVRRYNSLKENIIEKSVLDFGAGACGFLARASELAKKVSGVEPEKRVREYWNGKIELFASISELEDRKFDLITAFHVVEHLIDPADILSKLSNCLNDGGRIVIEVPNSEDALLTLFENVPFQNFTYWSQHLYLFNATTLNLLAKKAKLKVTAIQQYQRYPLSNHLHWLSKGKPGGHVKWSFLDTPSLEQAYSSVLASLGKCDTIIAYLEKSEG